MNFFIPSGSLFKRTHIDVPDQYFLHAVTFCNNTHYVADGFKIDDSKAKNKRVISIELNIREDKNAPSISTVKPVSHTIALGPLPFGDNGTIELNLSKEQENNINQLNKSGGKDKVILSSSGATEIERPIGDDESVEALWDKTFNAAFASI